MSLSFFRGAPFHSCFKGKTGKPESILGRSTKKTAQSDPFSESSISSDSPRALTAESWQAGGKAPKLRRNQARGDGRTNFFPDVCFKKQGGGLLFFG